MNRRTRVARGNQAEVAAQSLKAHLWLHQEPQGPRSLAEEDASILFVEDDPAIAEMYKLKLEIDGYRVMVVHSGEEALDSARSHLPDIVFLDIQLPKMDGFTVLRELRADAVTQNLPVVMLSAYSEKELRQRGLDLGALEYLIKSETTPASLSRSVDDWIRS